MTDPLTPDGGPAAVHAAPEPPPERPLGKVGPDQPFRVTADAAALWYRPGGDVLVVTLDNLATVEEPFPRDAWLSHRIQPLGHAVLGLQSMAKDWFRNPDAERLVAGLVAQGFFGGFRRVVFLGASMGGFAAINLATLVEGATVIALSPQSTMAPALAPFERRFAWAVRNSDWTTPRFLDAADAARRLARLILVLDNRVPEDRLHADRLDGPNVERLHVNHSTHEAVRVLLKCGALPQLLAAAADGDPVGVEFWRAMRARRMVRKWARQFMTDVERERSPRQTLAVADCLVRSGGYLFASQARTAALERLGNEGSAVEGADHPTPTAASPAAPADPGTDPSLTLFFIVEPPAYQYLACYLAASIRNHLPASVKIVGYCPAHRRLELNPAAVETLRRMDCDVRFFEATGKFDPPYPHGNKILACLEPRGTDFSAFVDSDVLLLRDNSIGNLVKAGHVSASPAASMRWAGQEVWTRIYGVFGMPVPNERIRLMRDKRQAVVPYMSSGLVVFPETYRTPRGETFPHVWYDTARRLDQIDDLPGKRPYLDQMSLPVAIARAGLTWNELPESQHYILGGSLRGHALPQDFPIFTVHYRKWDVLKEVGLSRQAYDGLRRQVGKSRVGRIFR